MMDSLASESRSAVRRTGSARTEKLAFRYGINLGAPTMPGMAAWGLVTGIAMAQSGLTLWQALGMTFLVYAGSAQFAALPLIAGNAPAWVVFATGLVLNLRFVIFGAGVGPHFSHLPWYKRVWYGYFDTDVAAAFFQQRYGPETRGRPLGKIGFYAGVGYGSWFAWQVGSVAGILMASQIPASWGVGFVGTLALLALMIPLIANAAALAGVAVASATAVLAYSLPYKLGLLLGVILGIAAAMVVDAIASRPRRLP